MKVNVLNMFPCRKYVHLTLIYMSYYIQKETNFKIPEIIAFGLCITCDGVKLDANDKKYYDFCPELPIFQDSL